MSRISGGRSEELLSLPAARGVRRLALSLLDKAQEARERLHDPDESDALHDFRVALRRLRSLLRAYDVEVADVPRKLARRLRRLARSTGTSRDLEVHIGWLRERMSAMTPRERVGASWLLEQLAERQVTEDAELLREVDDNFSALHRRLRRRLRTYRAPVVDDDASLTFATRTAKLLREQAEELGRCLAAVRAASDEEQAHAARISGKRLRYLLEPVASHTAAGDAVDRMKTLQDLLGDLHDAHVFSTEIVDAMSAAAAEQAQAISSAVLDGDDEGAERRARRRDPKPGLIALVRRLRQRADESFTALETWFLHDKAQSLIDEITAVAARLDEHVAREVEIERKYLLSGLPDRALGAPSIDIEQGYVPGERLGERLRLVRANGALAHWRTVKLGSGARRTEIEERTTPNVFDAMWPLTEGKRVYKRRYEIEDGDFVWQIDEFVDRSLVLVEVELPSADTQVELPEWLSELVVREVTDEKEFTNRNLAR